MSTASNTNATASANPSAALASLQNRFIASLIDGAILSACVMPVVFLLTWVGLPLGIFSAMIGTILAAAVFIALNYKLLDTGGQTIGKKIMNTRIVGRDDRPVPVQELLKRRYLPVFAIAAIPVLGGLIALGNALMIFRDSRACGHDDIANTKVVQL